MLVILAILSLLVFFVPERFKYAFTLLIVSLGVFFSVSEALFSWKTFVGMTPVFGEKVMFADSLSATFVIIISIAVLSITIYAKGYLAHYPERRKSLHYLAWMMLYFSMLFVVSSADGFSFLFAWELMTISSFVLILFEGEKREVRRAAINYLVLMHIGFIFLVSGFVLGAQDGMLGGFDDLGCYFSQNEALPLFLLLFVGFGMKAGVFPLHVWLPEAHPAAPSHVSAIMSGVMIKMGVYGVVRVLSYINDGLWVIGVIILTVGCVTALWGIVFASQQNDLKRLLAYSSMENIGIIFIGIGVGTIGLSEGSDTLAALGFAGALLHTVNHSLFKPVLFMNAGSVYLSTHTLNIDELGGLSKRMPLTTIMFLVGSMAICALPPFNGFVSEFLIYIGLLDGVSTGVGVIAMVMSMAILALVGGIAVLTFVKAFGVGFLGVARCCKTEKAREVPMIMIAAQALPLAGIVMIGIFPKWSVSTVMNVAGVVFPIVEMPEIASSMWGISLCVILLLAITIAIYILKSNAIKNRPVSESPTWGCGFTAPNKFMQYTGESFSEELSQMSSRLMDNSGKSAEITKDEIFASQRSFGVKHDDKVDHRLSQLWVYMARKINTRMALFQTGKINHYVLHALLFLIFIFLLTLIGVI